MFIMQEKKCHSYSLLYKNLLNGKIEGKIESCRVLYMILWKLQRYPKNCFLKTLKHHKFLAINAPTLHTQMCVCRQEFNFYFTTPNVSTSFRDKLHEKRRFHCKKESATNPRCIHGKYIHEFWMILKFQGLLSAPNSGAFW